MLNTINLMSTSCKEQADCWSDKSYNGKRTNVESQYVERQTSNGKRQPSNDKRQKTERRKPQRQNSSS